MPPRVDEASPLAERDTDLGEYEMRFYLEAHNEESVPFWRRTSTRKGDVAAAWGDSFFDGSSLLVQNVAIIVSAYLTHAVAFFDGIFPVPFGVFLSYAVVSTLGSTSMPQLAAAWNVGVFIGMAGVVTVPNWWWYTLLVAFVLGIWAIFVRFKVLVGYGGRLGTCVFIAHNLVVAIVVAAGAAPQDLYASSSRTYALVTWKLALCLLVTSPAAALLALYFRRLGHSMENPVTGGNASALLLMLVVASVTQHVQPDASEHTADALKGLSVGSFVGMASTDKLSGGAGDFALASMFAVGFTMLFAPFFDGFVILGFEAMLGCLVVRGVRWLICK